MSDPVEPIRIVIVDDSPVVRMGLRALVDTEADLRVVGEAGDGEEALRVVRRESPDVVLLDVRMPRKDGLSVLAEITACASVVMMTFTDEPGVIHQALAAGAVGYLVHGTFDAAGLAQFIRGAAGGVGAFSGPALTAIHQAVSNGATRGLRTGRHPLSQRQVEVMELISMGRSNSEIARTLFVAEKTVKNHINQIFAALGVETRAEAIAAWLGTDQPVPLGP